MSADGSTAAWQAEAVGGLGWRIGLADLYYVAFGLVTAPFWCFKLLTSSRYREGFARRFGFGHPDRRGEPKAVWVHGVSVGEVLAARDLIRHLREARPDQPVVITVTTRTGFAVAKRTYPDLPVTYFPMDIGWCVRRTMARVNAALLVLVELELWPNVLLECHRQAIPVAVVNGRITQRSFRGYRLIRWALAPALSRLASVCVQIGAYGERLMALGVPRERVRATGNLKYDAVDPSAAIERRDEMHRRLGIESGMPVLVAGSVHPGEAELIYQAVQIAEKSIGKPVKLIVVPRHPEKREEIATELLQNGLWPAWLTKLDDGEEDPSDSPLILVDTMGDLMAVYSVATMACVGGTWVPIGGHNPLEPASLGVPQLVGEHTFTIREQVKALEGVGALRRAHDHGAMIVAVKAWLSDQDAAAAAGARGRAVVEAERGATQRTWDVLCGRFPGLLGAQA